MAHITADAMTNGPAMQVHAGVNAQICKFVLGTASGSQTVALTPLPAGARILGVSHAMGDLGYGTGGELVSIYPTIGGTSLGNLIASAACIVSSNPVIGAANRATLIGQRLTSSAILVASYTNNVGTGTGSTNVTVVVTYLANQRGD